MYKLCKNVHNKRNVYPGIQVILSRVSLCLANENLVLQGARSR